MDLNAALKLALLVFAVSGNSLLAILVFKSNPKSATNKVFFALSTVISIWLIANFISLYPPFIDYSLYLIRFSIFFAVPVSSLFFLLACTLPSNQLKLNVGQLLIILLVSGLTMLITLTPYTFTKIEVINNSPIPTPGPGIALFSLVTTLFSILAVITLIKKFKKAGGAAKEQFRYVMLGIFLMLSLVIVTVLIPVILFKISFFVSFIPVYTLVFLGMTTYAIIRHRLMDIRFVIARTLAYSGLIILIGFFYVASTYVISASFFGLATSIHQMIIYAVLTLIVALSFGSVKDVVEKISDKIFFKANYDSNKLLAQISAVLSTNIDLGILVAKILQVLIDQMHISMGTFVFLEKDKIYDVITSSETDKPHITFSQIEHLLSQKEIVVFDELEEGDLKNAMRQLHISISKTLKVQNEIIGLLLIGEKSSGEIYSDQDIKVLNILTSEAAVAFQNAQSYDKIKKFNITLTEEVKKATQDLQKANIRLEELDQLKDDFVSIASHELRTPMTAIRSYAWMALNKPDIPLTEKLKKYLSRTLLSTERLINLVNDMLNISRIESGRIEIIPKEFDIVALVQEVFNEVEEKAKEKALHLQLISTPLPKIFADPDKVHQVLLNLIGNSLKFTPNDGIIKVTFFSDGKVVETKVADTGVGVSKDDLQRLFKKFSRLDNTYVAAATSGGTGLGLFICKSLIELMKGRIWANSGGEGKGAEFIFMLPAATREVLERSEEFTNRVEGTPKVLEPAVV